MRRLISFSVVAALTWCMAGPGAQVLAQTSYWMPEIKSDGKIRTYTYSIKVPDFFVPWVLKENARGGGKAENRTINGASHTFYKQGFTWHLAGSNPLGTGQIRIDNNKERHLSNDWVFESKLKADANLIKSLDTLAHPAYDGTWREVDLLVLKWTKGGEPKLVFREVIPLLEQHKTTLLDLAKRTKAGSYYGEAQVPADLSRYQQSMLAIGNLGRRDVDYRKKHGEKEATDLSGATARTSRGEEKIFKHYKNLPYLRELTLNDALSKAAQFHAEYQASRSYLGHTGPENYKGADLRGFEARVRYFGYKFNTEGEGAGKGSPTSYPEGWMKSDTHYRPWFNIGQDVREVGLGAAKGPSGDWYFCVVSGLGDPKATPFPPAGKTDSKKAPKLSKTPR